MKKRKNPLKKIYDKRYELYHRLSLRYTIWVSFTISAVVMSLFIAISLYSRLNNQLQSTIQKESQGIIEQVNNTLTIYLRNMMKVSDSLYYNVIKNSDIETDNMESKFQLLYDTNRESMFNIALFGEDGELIVATPASTVKEKVDVTNSKWYQVAMDKKENMHFSNPEIQNLFETTDDQFPWVISLSRAVQVNKGTQTSTGVLLIELQYGMLELIFNDVTLGNGGYLYLVDKTGEMIYHPMESLIASGEYQENHEVVSQYKDGIYEEQYQGEDRVISVKSVGYTGWKIIGVTPQKGIQLNGLKNNLFIGFLILFFTFILFLINSFISSKVSLPILKLEKSVELLAKGDLEAEIEVIGVHEVHHLGVSIQKMAARIKKLMDDSVRAEKTKRKNELNVLQSQINPHFLYNTLDIIVWMIENEKKSEAVKVVMALSRFFRISLSKGQSIISIKNEIEHVRSYLTIQNMRFKNRFKYFIEIDEEIEKYSTIKLVLQPLVENAIYHGMEFMDGDGEIRIYALKEEEDIFIYIEDNGFGMTREVVERIMEGKVDPKGKGSGIGINNVNERIKLYYGQEYGITIQSEPDEGTTIMVHIPAILYDEIKKTE
ncbi:MAG TPA: sensor histidine kinase [Candidatus Merdenecus merdavium]|nr:sensor histidine kinase [Candidatus Merdenecus merdavium]